MRPIRLAAAILSVLPIYCIGGEPKGTAGGTQFIAAPYILANSDEGIVGGFVSGFSTPPSVIMYSSLNASTLGHFGFGFFTQKTKREWTLLVDLSATHIVRYLYPPGGDDPEPIARALVNRLESDVSAFWRLGQNIEIGPNLTVDVSRGERPEDGDGNNLDIRSMPVLQFGSNIQIGPRMRLMTTSPVRPLDGYILDASIRGGVSHGGLAARPQFDWSTDLLASVAKPLAKGARVYIRGLWSHQRAAAPPNQLALTSSWGVRGQPVNRDYGRRTIALRGQTYLTAFREWRSPTAILHRILKFIPVMNMDLEMAAFLDAAMVGDQSYGWRKRRVGYGGGFRFVFPPELVGFIDIAKSPGRGLMFYIGTGEVL